MSAAPGAKVDPGRHFNNETDLLSSEIHSSHATAATRAKRVTFFKSGDGQFGGVRMAVHNRSFKCFDALLDDLSQRVPLPFGVRTITTPRGIHSINRLEQLEDGGCYLCSDHRHVKPISMETFRRRSNVWHPGYLHRKPSQPEDVPTAHSTQRCHWHPKTIVLVKNNDPTVRRSIILSRRTTRNLRVFMDEISQLMQCHIRKLYTLEGRKIDSIQSLMQCPSVLVCVGREPFHPLLVESLRKSSDEKLPGLASRSRSSICSENHESKKNVNFGLETKKSIIHPRSDSSNRSARFSLSSEKSCPSGLCMTHVQTRHACPHAQDALMNDDIEKRVLVNEDGSLSVEMKVRFRLFNDETLQWSTEIKKSVGTVNDTSLGNEESCYLQQGKSETCSESESNIQCEHEELYIPKCNQRHLDESQQQCQSCCNHCKEYDIWKNPMHGDQGCIRHFRSSSSSASSHEVVCRQESVDSMPTISRSSDEYAEHVIQKAACFQQTVKAGGTRVEYGTISRSCSCSEVCAKSDSLDKKCKSPENDEIRCNSLASVGIRSSQKEQVSVRITQISEERPVSAMSSTSKILEALKGYQDDEDTDDDDLPLSVSRASLRSQSDNPEDSGKMGSIASNCSTTAQKSVYSMNHLPPKPPNKASICCPRSAKSRHNSTTVFPTIELPVNQAENENNEAVGTAISAISKRSSRYRKSHNSGTASAVPGNVKVAIAESDSRKACTRLTCSNASRLSKKSYNMTSLKTDIPESLRTDLGSDGQDGNERDISISQKSEVSNACPRCGGSDGIGLKASENLYDMNVEDHSSRSVSSVSDRTTTSERSMESENYKNITRVLNISKNVTNSQLRKDEEVILERPEMSMSAKTNDSEKNYNSNESKIVHGEELQEILETEEIAPHTTLAKINSSAQSRMSKKSNSNASIKSSQQSNTSEYPAKKNPGREDEDTEKSAVRAKSGKPKRSSDSRQSNKFQYNASQTSESVATDNICNQEAETEPEGLARSALSALINASDRVGKSNNSKCNASDRAVDKGKKEEKVSSEMSYGSMKLERSEASVSQHNAPVLNDSEDRAASTVSAGTKVSWKSTSSDTNPCGACDGASKPATPLPKISGDCENDDELESEMRVRSSSSVNYKASDTKKPSICQSNDTKNSRTSLSVKIPKSDIDQTEERDESAVSYKSQASATSTKSNSIANKKIAKATSKSVTLHTANGKELEQNEDSVEERLKGNVSFKNNVSEQSKVSRESDHCSSKSISTPTKTLQGDEQEVTSVDSVCRKTPTKCKISSHLNINDDRVPSALSSGSARNKSSFGDLEPRSRDSSVSEHRERDFQNEDVSESGTVIKKGTASMRDADKELARICDHESVHSIKKSSRKDKKTSRTNTAAMSIVPCNCLSPSPSKETPKENKSPALQHGNSHDSNLSHSISAADLLRERSEDVRPDTAESKRRITEKTYNCVLRVTESYKNVSDNKNDKGSRCRHRKRNSSSLQKKEAEILGIMPSCLPNASPTEVVHDWLKKIPADSPMYDAGEECHGQAYETDIQKNPTENEEESVPKDSMKFEGEPVVAEKENKEENDGIEADDENIKLFEESKGMQLPNVDEKPPTKCANREALPISCQSSVRVMKVLLSPKFDRCNSLPEVSPVYGRKLSKSAKGLLDCLANLQLIDKDPADVTARDARCNELMNILQSLWFCDPLDGEKSVPFKNHRSVDDPKSSSGIDVSSGSAGSGKGNGNGGEYQAQKTELPLSTAMALVDQNPLQPLQEETEFTASSSRLILDAEEVLQNPATPDIAMRVRGSPVSEEEGTDATKQEDKHKGLNSNETIRSDESPKEITGTPSTSNKSSGIEGNIFKLPDDTVTDLKDVASSRILPYSENIRNKKVSKDPDPVWVLNLLKKLEKQFMTHYVNAMAEFKVRWDLDDNVILDAMINELRDEVSKRIQSSINRELQKLQSRAGREPRPPLQSISQESSAQTEQRRRRLKVMHNKSIEESLQRSEENYTVTGTDFSDQRSEDGHCPCETCVKKKMASRLVEQKRIVSSAPVMMDFDLRKILQLKREPPAIVKEQEEKTLGGDGNLDTNKNLTVLQEGERNREKAKLKELQRAGMETETDEPVESISTRQKTGNQSEERQGGTAEDDAGKTGKDSEGIDVAEKEENGQVYGEIEAGDGEPMNDGIAEENTAEDSEEIEEGVAKEEDKETEVAIKDDLADQNDITDKNIASDAVAEGLADADTGEADKHGASEECSRALVENTGDENAEHSEVDGEADLGGQTTEDYLGEENRTHKDDDSHCVGTPEEHSADKVDNAEGENPESSEDGDSVKEDGCDQLKEISEQAKEEENAATERQETENIDVTIRVVDETCSTEGNAEDRQPDSDMAEDKSETCVVARFTVEENLKNGPGETEPDNASESGYLIKQITKSSIESQPGSIEAALDEDRNVKSAELPDDSGASKESEDISSIKQLLKTESSSDCQ